MSNIESIDDLLLPVRIMIGNNYGDPTESNVAKDWWNHYDKLKVTLTRREKLIKVEALKQGFNQGVYAFSNYYMDASIASQRIPIMPSLAKELVENYDPTPYVVPLEQQLKTLDGQEAQS